MSRSHPALVHLLYEYHLAHLPECVVQLASRQLAPAQQQCGLTDVPEMWPLMIQHVASKQCDLGACIACKTGFWTHAFHLADVHDDGRLAFSAICHLPF